MRALALRVAGARLRDADAAEEVAQEVLARAWRAAPAKKTLESPEAWLVVLSGREVLRYAERRARRAAREQAVGDDPTPAEAMPSHAVEVDLRVGLLAAVRELSPLDRTLIALHYFGDVPLASVARDLEMPVGSVKARLSRARARLAKELAP